MLSPKRATFSACAVVPGAAAPASSADALLDFRILPVTDDHFAVDAHPRADEAEFAVAVRRLVQVHEIHVDRRPREYRG